MDKIEDNLGPFHAQYNKFTSLNMSGKQLGLFCLSLMANILMYRYKSDPIITTWLSNYINQAEIGVTDGLYESNFRPQALRYHLLNWYLEGRSPITSENRYEFDYLIKACIHATVCGNSKTYSSLKHSYDNNLYHYDSSFVDTYDSHTTAYLCVSRCYQYIDRCNLPLLDPTYLYFNNQINNLLNDRFINSKNINDFNGLPAYVDGMETIQVFKLIHRRHNPRLFWSEIVKEECDHLGVDEEYVRNSISDIGILYNRLDSQWIPIPGEIVDFSDTPKHMIGQISGIKIGADGNINVIFKSWDRHRVPLIFYDDILVCIALSFIYQKEPSFSLDNGIDNIDDPMHHSILQKKVFSPEWLSGTRFGKDLYYADYLMQQTIAIDQAPLQSILYPNISRENIDSSDSILEIISKNYPSPEKGRFCLKLSDMEISTYENNKVIIVDYARAYFETSLSIIDEDGCVNHMHRLNDTETTIGKIGYSWSRDFENLCEFFPTIKRAEQLLILYKLFETCRTMGFWQPSAEMLRSAESLALTAGRKSRYSYVPVPFHKRGCRCSGKWPDMARVKIS